MGKRKRVASKQSEELTQLVVDYLETKNPTTLQEIIRQSGGLIGTVLRYYGMQYFPVIDQEEVVMECKGRILLKALDGYQRSKGAFSTYYTWKLKSFLRMKKEFLMRRANLIESASLDAEIEENASGRSTSLSKVMTKFDIRIKQRVSRSIQEIFGM